MASIQAEGSAADQQQLHALTGFWNLTLKHIDTMCVKCALELGIPDIIHNHGQPMSLPELAAALALPSTKSSHLRRVMRVLTHSGFFSKKVSDDEEDMYLLTPVSLLVVKETKSAGLSKTQLVPYYPIVGKAFQFMGSWFRSESPTSATPFKLAHGHDFWDEANVNPEFNAIFNASMASDSSLLLDVLVKDCGDVFRSLVSLVDVGGGTGSTARAIAEAFPQVKCSVLDLPHVVDTVPKDEIDMVDFIAGDMFKYVPPANAVLLKSIMHDWGDEDCIRILRRCKEAIPCRAEGGKVIIIDMVVGSSHSHPKAMETQLHWDIKMFVLAGGAEREEHDWRNIFVSAGFADYKITPALGLRSVIEVYP